MANNKKFVVKNGLTTSNIEFKDDINNGTNTITMSMLSTDVLSFSGDSGQLFSISDSLTGTIFSVNDISGIPSVEVDDDGTIRLAEFAGNILVGSNTDYAPFGHSQKLQVTGNTSVLGDLYLTSTRDDPGASPSLTFYRNSASPADGDYLGQILWYGKDDGLSDELYALVAAKILDANNSTEDTAIETVVRGNGSFTFVSRQTSDELQLINGVGLSVNGSITVDGTVDGRDVAADGTKLDGIEAGATADQTASEILTAIKTVDGSGSGLDADLLDGQQGGYYTQTVSDTSLNSGNDLNSLTDGYYSWTSSQPTNSPGDNYMILLQVSDGGQPQQLAWGGNSNGKMYMRRRDSGTWNSWTKVWTNANDGAGSGLDADLLDGQQGSYYLNTSTSFGGDVSGTYNNIVVSDDSHNHSSSSGNFTVGGDLTVSGGQVGVDTVSTRHKYSVYGSSSQYAIGMQSGITFGGLADWGMTFQFNNDNDRGFWWGDESHSTAQGAMALTTNGKLTVAHSTRIGYGETDTTIPGSTHRVDVNGSVNATTYHGDGSNLTGISAGGGATGGGSDKIFHNNDQTVTTSYTIPSGQNSMTAGPISINSGVTVTVPSGSEWTIV